MQIPQALYASVVGPNASGDQQLKLNVFKYKETYTCSCQTYPKSDYLPSEMRFDPAAFNLVKLFVINDYPNDSSDCKKNK